MLKSLRSFIAGFLASAVLTGSLATVIAAGDVNISAKLSSTFKMKLFGRDFNPQETDGTYIKPIVYNNRTYLPVRALSEAVNIPVEWDGATSTIWIGGKTDSVPVNDASMFDNDNSDSILTTDTDKLTTSDTTYKWGITNSKTLNMVYFNAFLKTGGKYKKFSASLFLDTGSKKDVVIEFRKSSDGRDRKGIVLRSVTLKPGVTQDIDIDIGGVEQIFITSTVNHEVKKLIIGEPTFSNGGAAVHQTRIPQ